MSSYLLFLILGLGSGATYAILGQGLVLKYRSAGVVDFAHGAVAMFIAYVFVNLRSFGELELPLVLLPHQISLNGGAGLAARPRDRHLAGLRGRPRAAALRHRLPAAAERVAAHPGLRVGRGDAHPAGDRGAQLQHRAGHHQPDLPQLGAVAGRDHVPRGPAVLHRRGGRHLGRARARLPVHPVRPRHQGGGRERQGRRADRHLRHPHRGPELGHRDRAGGRGRHPDRAGLQPRPDLLHAVRGAGPGGRADRPDPVVLDHRAGRPADRLRPVRDREARLGLLLAAAAGPARLAPVRRHHRGDGGAGPLGARPRRRDGRAQPVGRPARAPRCGRPRSAS